MLNTFYAISLKMFTFALNNDLSTMGTRFTLWVILLLIASGAHAQDDTKKKKAKEKNAFGIQVKPIIPSSMFRIVTDEVKEGDILYAVTPETGYSFGAMIRFGLTPRLAIQTDINYIKRNFTFSVTDPDSALNTSFPLRVVSYEIPVLATYFVRLSRDVYMGPTVGPSFQFLPTNLFSNNDYVKQHSLKTSWLSLSMVVNLGFEWRTASSGYFYFGPTYHMYQKPMFTSGIFYKGYNNVNNPPDVIMKLRGDYFGLIFRYVFAPN